jgi:NAD(P)-dependent dehydrogenase (short-subunit alcohol dehydrogenase family)
MNTSTQHNGAAQQDSGPKGAVLVTGGSRGIGAATALLAASRGYPVSIVFRDRVDNAEALVARIRASGGRAIAVKADIAIEQDIKRAFKQTRDQLGPIEALVNNAATTGGIARLRDMTAEQLTGVFAANVTGAFLCAREFVAQLPSEDQPACIVNVSSRASVMGSPGVWVHYAASKGAMDTMTLGLAKELAPRGIRVNCVRPGFIDTELHAQRSADAVAAIVKSIPMGRMGRPGEVANVIVWLLSREASYVTGALIDVAGGV